MSNSPKYQYFITDSFGREHYFQADDYVYSFDDANLQLFSNGNLVANFNKISSFTQLELSKL